MALVSDHPLYLLGLRFPLRLRVTVRQGFVTLHNEITTKKLGSGDSFVVPAFLRFACDVMPGRGKPAVFTLALGRLAELKLISIAYQAIRVVDLDGLRRYGVASL